MRLPRRQFLHLAAGGEVVIARARSARGNLVPHARGCFALLAMTMALIAALPRTALAQVYPAQPVRIVVGFAAGGTQDIIARLMGQWLSQRSGQQFIIENRPGAAGNIAAEVVIRATADGYTLLMVGLSNAVNASLYDKLNFEFIRDIAPVAAIGRVPGVMLVNPSF